MDVEAGRRYLRQIKRVELVLLRLLKGHDLDEEAPGREVAGSDGVVQISDGVVWVSGCQVVCILPFKVLDALVSLGQGGVLPRAEY